MTVTILFYLAENILKTMIVIKKKKNKDIFSWESKEILLQKNNKDYERLKKFRISQEYPSQVGVFDLLLLKCHNFKS